VRASKPRCLGGWCCGCERGKGFDKDAKSEAENDGQARKWHRTKDPPTSVRPMASGDAGENRFRDTKRKH
jgi:hypothetical protein